MRSQVLIFVMSDHFSPLLLQQIVITKPNYIQHPAIQISHNNDHHYIISRKHLSSKDNLSKVHGTHIELVWKTNDREKENWSICKVFQMYYLLHVFPFTKKKCTFEQNLLIQYRIVL